MKTIKQKFLLIITLLLLCIIALLTTSCNSNTAEPTSSIIQNDSSPFQIQVTNARIVQEPKKRIEGNQVIEESGTETRLKIEISILNNTKQEFKNTSYDLELNPEVAPFIAHQILQFRSDPFYVIPQEQFQKEQETLKVTGFEHEWNSLLTDPNDLKTYHDKTIDQIGDYLHSITVTLTWDGGSQVETIPLQLPS